MVQKTIAGVTIDVTKDGFFTNPSQWTKEMAVEIASEEDIVLTDQHFAVIEFLRNRYNNGNNLSIRSINQSGLVDVKTFYHLFPGAPLRKASRIAGLPKPSSCV